MDYAITTRSLDDRIARGERLFDAGDVDNAEQLFRELLADNPANPPVLNNLAVICHSRGDILGACALLALTLEIEPGNQDACQNLHELLQGFDSTTLQSTSLLLWPWLVDKLVNGKLSADASLHLRKIVNTLTDSQKTFTLRQLLHFCDTAETIVAVLSTISAVDRETALAIGEWLAKSVQPRAIRDLVEDLLLRTTHDREVVTRVCRRDAPPEADERNRLGYEFGPRRITADFVSHDPFMKHVPADAPSKEHGMRILLMADYNIVGQMTAIMRALNKYTNHCARCVIFQEDYLSYDRDIIVRDESGVVSDASLDETRALIERADFFHFGRQLLPIQGIDWNRWISPRNAVFQYFGSEIRNNPKETLDFHNRTGFTALTACDWTMYKAVKSSFYHIQPYMMEVDDLPKAAMDLSRGIRICHAPSNQNYRNLKRSEVILDNVRRLQSEFPSIESVVIEGRKNRDCLELKSRCHMHVVSLLVTFGFNAIESAAMGLVPIVQLDNFTRLLYPDAPVVHATESSLFNTMKSYAQEPERLHPIGQACREWARREFDSRTMIQRYWYLYDLVYHGQSIGYPELFR